MAEYNRREGHQLQHLEQNNIKKKSKSEVTDFITIVVMYIFNSRYYKCLMWLSNSKAE